MTPARAQSACRSNGKPAAHPQPTCPLSDASAQKHESPLCGMGKTARSYPCSARQSAL